MIWDAMGIVGNGVSFQTLSEAGIDHADLLIAVTGSDEQNLLCCVIAKKAGHCKTIARVRNPIYNNEIAFLREELGLAMIINRSCPVPPRLPGSSSFLLQLRSILFPREGSSFCISA